MSDKAGTISRDTTWRNTRMATNEYETLKNLTASGSKSKRWVVISSDLDIEELYKACRKLDCVEAALAAHFENGNFAIVYKKLNFKFDMDNVQIFTATEGRANVSDLLPALETFKDRSLQAVGDIYTVRNKSDIWNFDQVVEELLKNEKYDQIKLFADIKYAKETNIGYTPFYKGIMVASSEVKKWMTAMCKAKEFIHRADKKDVLDYPEGFRGAASMIGLAFDPDLDDGKIVQHTFADYTDTELHFTHSAIVVGPSSIGKSKLIGGCGRMFCRRYDFQIYVLGKSIDPYGALSMNGTLERCGALLWTDFTMRSLRDEKVGKEAAKSLFDVEEGGQLPARWHAACLPPEKPHMFAINSGKEKDGEPDWEDWFRENKLKGLKYLVNGDEEKLRAASEHDKAMARRVIIFKAKKDSWERSAENREKLKTSLRDRVKAGMEREKALREQ